MSRPIYSFKDYLFKIRSMVCLEIHIDMIPKELCRWHCKSLRNEMIKCNACRVHFTYILYLPFQLQSGIFPIFLHSVIVWQHPKHFPAPYLIESKTDYRLLFLLSPYPSSLVLSANPTLSLLSLRH